MLFWLLHLVSRPQANQTRFHSHFSRNRFALILSSRLSCVSWALTRHDVYLCFKSTLIARLMLNIKALNKCVYLCFVTQVEQCCLWTEPESSTLCSSFPQTLLTFASQLGGKTQGLLWYWGVVVYLWANCNLHCIFTAATAHKVWLLLCCLALKNSYTRENQYTSFIVQWTLLLCEPDADVTLVV